MGKISSNTALTLLANQRPTYMFPNVDEKTITFDGGTVNGIGDVTGTNNPYTIATVTGQILVSVLAVCQTDLASGLGGTVRVGTVKDDSGIITITTATALDEDEIWNDNSPNTNAEEYTLGTPTAECFLVSDDIIITSGISDTTSGVIKFVFRWTPISSDGNLEV